MAKPVIKYVVNHPNVTKFVAPGGEVTDAINGIIRDGRKFAKAFAPVRTGGLVRGIKASLAKQTGVNTTQGFFYGNSRHTLWVNDGTSRIHARNGFMLIPTGPGQTPWSTTTGGGGGSTAFKIWNARGRKGRKGFTTKDSVRGQRGQHFMEKALSAAMAEFRAGG